MIVYWTTADQEVVTLSNKEWQEYIREMAAEVDADWNVTEGIGNVIDEYHGEADFFWEVAKKGSFVVFSMEDQEFHYFDTAEEAEAFGEDEW